MVQLGYPPTIQTMIPLLLAKLVTRFARSFRGLPVAGLTFVAAAAFSAEQPNATAPDTNSTSFAFSDPADLFAIESWTTEHGLPQTSITAVLQTRSGYLWAATVRRHCPV